MSVGLPTSMSYLHVMSYCTYEKNIVKDYFCFRPMIDVAFTTELATNWRASQRICFPNYSNSFDMPLNKHVPKQAIELNASVL